MAEGHFERWRIAATGSRRAGGASLAPITVGGPVAWRVKVNRDHYSTSALRWSAAARGAPAANARRGLCSPAVLPPSMPAGDVVIHDALADEAARYVPHDGVVSGGLDQARDLDL